MRLKKQSMREVRDAGMIQRTEGNSDVIINSAADSPHFKQMEKRIYIRGALVKGPKRSDNRK